MRASARLPAAAWLAAVGGGAFAIAALFLVAAGKDPFAAAAVLAEHALLSRDGFVESLLRAIPLTLAGLGIVIAFRANVYNIGGDGQFIAGAIAGVAASLGLGLSGWLALPVILLGAAAGGAIFGGFAGWLRARFDANEIIVTIMLNYVALQLLAWAIRGPLQEGSRVIPRSDAIAEAARLPALWEGGPHAGLLVAVFAILALSAAMRVSVFGYQLMATGENRAAADAGGIPTRRIIVLALALSGAGCGLAGGVEVAGVFHRLEESMAPGIGIGAIAVALLARLEPLLVPLTAFLLGVLAVGAGALQRQLAVPFPLIWIVEAVIIIAFLLAGMRRRARAGDG